MNKKQSIKIEIVLLLILSILLYKVINDHKRNQVSEKVSINKLTILNHSGEKATLSNDSYLRIDHMPNSQNDKLSIGLRFMINEQIDNFQIRTITNRKLTFKKLDDFDYAIKHKAWEKKGEFINTFEFADTLEKGEIALTNLYLEGNFVKEMNGKSMLDLNIVNRMIDEDSLTKVIFFGGDELLFDYFYPTPTSFAGNEDSPKMFSVKIGAQTKDPTRNMHDVSFVASNIFHHEKDKDFLFKNGIFLAILTSLIATVLIDLTKKLFEKKENTGANKA